MAFEEKDAENVARIKDKMAEQSLAGDPASARAYATLVNAETLRAQVIPANAGAEKAAVTPPATSWTEKIATAPETEQSPAL